MTTRTPRSCGQTGIWKATDLQDWNSVSIMGRTTSLWRQTWMVTEFQSL